MLTKVQTVIKLAHCTLFVLQIVHRCDSGPRTVRPAHQITMAGDKVLSGDCRFARRNYFPDARKEIVACVTMAKEPSPTVPRHGDAQRVSPRHFSPAVVATAFFFTPSPLVRFAGVLLHRFFPAVPTPLSKQGSLGSPPLGESWRASFNEKLISRVKSRRLLLESRISSSFSSCWYCPPSWTLLRLYSASLFVFSPHLTRPFLPL